MKGYHRCLEPEAGEQYHRYEFNEFGSPVLLHDHGNICDIQGGSAPVEQAHTEKDKEGRYTSQYLILEGGLELLLVDAEGHECIGRNRRHFEKHVQVEYIAAQHHTVHSCNHEEEEGVIIIFRGERLDIGYRVKG